MGMFGKRPPPQPTERDVLVASMQRDIDEAETRYLDALRREIANMLVTSDPERFDKLYRKAAAYESEMAEADLQRVEAEEAALLAKFRRYPDFEVLGSYHMQPYADARWHLSDDALADRYLEVCRMLMFLRRRDRVDAGKPLFDQRERDAQSKFRRRALDTRLKHGIEEAMLLFNAYRRGLGASGSEPGSEAFSYEDGRFRVFVAPRVLYHDMEWAVVIKATGEVGICSHLVTDDTRHVTYYRSDADLQRRDSLDVL